MEEEEKIKQLTSISFPNTSFGDDRCGFSVKNGYNFELIRKNGEMASINWIRVTKDDKIIAEIKESVCDLYFN